MPHPRNPFFTGREDVLTQLRDALTAGRSAALTQATSPQAISGLGGIGKTQTAVEYAYRHQDEYDCILWAGAGDETTLREGFVEIARLLGLPQAQEADQSLAVQAVKAWLETNAGWLLILDNADEPKAVRPFMPPQRKGHVLLTTRASALGALAQKVEIRKLSEDDGALLLLRRAKLVKENDPLNAAGADNWEAALAFSHAVDGLPLALDQAGAFIEETQGSPIHSLALYGIEATALLAEYGDPGDHDHASVRVTYSLAFAKVREASPATGELIRCCAFLAPDAIPEEIFTEGEATWNEGPGPFGVTGLAWEKLVGDACRYSLLSRDASARTLSLHRLVQTVIRHELDAATRRTYAERLVRAVNRVFPSPEVSNWPQCERLLPHARECATHIASYAFKFEEAAWLLNQAGYYLYERGQFAEVEPLFQRGLLITETAPGPDHPTTATSLNNLAILYNSQGRYEDALPLYQRALSIRETALGPEHPSTALSLNNLAELHRRQGQYADALPLFQRALSVREKVLGPGHPDTAGSLNNLANLYDSQGRYEEALPLYQQALSIHEAALGTEHPSTATSLSNLAGLYDSQGQFEDALPLFLRALTIREQVLGPEHPDTALSLNDLALLYDRQGRYEDALPLYQRALSIREQVLGPEHPDTATSLNNPAGLYFAQGQYAEAEPLYQRALSIREQVLGPEHPDTALSLNNLAELHRRQGRYADALPLYQRALSIREQVLGPEHPSTATSLNNLAGLNESQGKYADALPLYQRALAIVEKVLGPEHPTTIILGKNYTRLLGKMNPP